MDTTAIADDLWRDLQAGRHMPARWSGQMGMEEAYVVQLAILDRYLEAGKRQAGWKVGLTAAAMRAQQGVHEPCFGFLLESGARPSGHRFAFDELIAPGFENELCLTVGTALAGPDVDLEQARAAVTHAAPALEIIEKRGDLAGDLALALADNAQQKAFVTGEPVALTPENGDLGQSDVSVYVNSKLAEQASGANVMESGALLSVVWLANKLAEFGRTISAGDLIMSGSFTKQYTIERGDKVRCDFAPFGVVEASFD
jgi:2-keto-4-pentenoate hydratase